MYIYGYAFLLFKYMYTCNIIFIPLQINMCACSQHSNICKRVILCLSHRKRICIHKGTCLTPQIYICTDPQPYIGISFRIRVNLCILIYNTQIYLYITVQRYIRIIKYIYNYIYMHNTSQISVNV